MIMPMRSPPRISRRVEIVFYVVFVSPCEDSARISRRVEMFWMNQLTHVARGGTRISRRIEMVQYCPRGALIYQNLKKG